MDRIGQSVAGSPGIPRLDLALRTRAKRRTKCPSSLVIDRNTRKSLVCPYFRDYDDAAHRRIVTLGH